MRRRSRWRNGSWTERSTCTPAVVLSLCFATAARSTCLASDDWLAQAKSSFAWQWTRDSLLAARSEDALFLSEEFPDLLRDRTFWQGKFCILVGAEDKPTRRDRQVPNCKYDQDALEPARGRAPKDIHAQQRDRSSCENQRGASKREQCWFRQSELADQRRTSR